MDRPLASVRRNGSGVTLTWDSGERVEIREVGDARVEVSGDPRFDGWSVALSEGGRFSVRRGDEERAWCFVEPGEEGLAGVRYLLLDDGRVFRIVASVPPDTGYELHGREVAAPYLEARPEREGWTVGATAAGTALDRREELALLLALAAAVSPPAPLRR